MNEIISNHISIENWKLEDIKLTISNKSMLLVHFENELLFQKTLKPLTDFYIRDDGINILILSSEKEISREVTKLKKDFENKKNKELPLIRQKLIEQNFDFNNGISYPIFNVYLDDRITSINCIKTAIMRYNFDLLIIDNTIDLCLNKYAKIPNLSDGNKSFFNEIELISTTHNIPIVIVNYDANLMGMMLNKHLIQFKHNLI